MTRLFQAISIALLLPLSAQAQSHPEAKSIVAVGGLVTEIIYELGQQDRLVARDSTSLYPAEARALPDVGYMRRLSAEGVLSVGPDLIITRNTAGPVEALDQLRAAAVPVVEVVDGYSPESVISAVEVIGRALGVEGEAEAMTTALESEFATLATEVAGGPSPRVMFILSNQSGRLNVAGAGTGANGILRLAGAVNVMEGSYQGYKIMSDEAIISAAPDIILMMKPRGGGHDGRKEEILAIPAISQTPAGQNGALVTVDGAALGFGPRTADLARQLRKDLLAVAAQ